MSMAPRSVGLEAKAALRAEMSALKWVHQIELGEGIVTPGRWPPHPLILKAFAGIDFRGKKVLDIGCWDGLWSFEAERRGAGDVFATDYVSQRSFGQPTFQLAHRALESRVHYYPSVSVHNIEELGVRDFDVIIFCGVYYHLRHPLHAISKLRRVAKEGATIIVEGDAIYGTEESYAEFFYSELHHNDPSNWHVATIRCVREWLESSFFKVANEYMAPDRRGLWQRVKDAVKPAILRHARDVRRYVVTAKAVSRTDPKYIFPDDDFCEFDRNKYSV